MKLSLILSTILFISFSCGKSEDENKKVSKKFVSPKNGKNNLGNLDKRHLKKTILKKTPVLEDFSAVDISTIINDIENPRSKKGERAFKVVKAYGKRAIPHLVKALSHKKQMVRIQSLRFLGNLGSASKSAVPKLKEMFNSEKNNAIISMIIDTIGKIKFHSPELEIIVAKYLESKASLVRWQATKVLGLFGPKSKKQIPQLKKLLADPENWIRLTAAKSIWQIDKTDISSFTIIGKDIDDSNRNFRKKFVKSIGEIRNHPKVIVPLLAKALEDKAKPIRRIAAKLLGKFGKSAKSALPNLKKAAEQGDYSLKQYSNQSIKSITNDK